MHMDIGSHLADDVLETVFAASPSGTGSSFRGRALLVCEKCQIQAEQTQEYIQVTRRRSSPTGQAPQREVRARAGFLHSWLTFPVSAAVVAAVAAVVFLPCLPLPVITSLRWKYRFPPCVARTSSPTCTRALD